MKILIVDDNVAVQEIIKDILAEEGHDAHVASSVDEAVLKIGSFDPDIVMLDTWVGDEDGLRVINRCRENREDRPLNVILIKSLGEQVPKDNPFIRGYIDKPFKSTDVLTVLKNVIDIIRTEEEQNSGKKGKKKKKRSSFSLFRKKPTKVQTCNTDISEEGLVHGTSYVIFEKDPKDIYTFVGLFRQGEGGQGEVRELQDKRGIILTQSEGGVDGHPGTRLADGIHKRFRERALPPCCGFRQLR